jgi:hypothetical protein
MSASAQRPLNAPADIYINVGSLNNFPNYSETGELETIPEQHTCVDSECESFVSNNNTFLHAVLINSSNYLDILPGTWTGGSCSSDSWTMDESGNFNSRFPVREGVKAWSGTYRFENNLYIEDGFNNDNKKEYNQAHLYYIAASENLIYKGYSGYQSTDENGEDIYNYYEGPDFFFFRRCP